MLQFNPALAWTMSRPVSKTYGNQEPTSKSPRRWRAKVKTFLTCTTKRKEKDEESKKSLEDIYRDRPLPEIPSFSSSSSASFIIIGIEDAIERDVALFSPRCVSSSSLAVHVGETYLDDNSAEACVRRGAWRKPERREDWDMWEDEMESRLDDNEDGELERALSHELKKLRLEQSNLSRRSSNEHGCEVLGRSAV
ncbi:hypothetical protein E6O75_ATG01463 [Venturia nashicola]|uniref:Uncharacterized protein n=1 Tax=Venturia nashicola TaxID=86259 RepID=A0A4Z1PDX3_9PEZI|nr:hypothetical protein E6O75_ATG01463 [Venturia nashicola]